MTEESFVPFKREKEDKLRKNLKLILKFTKKKKIKSSMQNEIKQEIIKKIEKKEINDFKFSFLFILFFSEDFEEIKKSIKSGDLDTAKLKDDKFWKNPSKKLLIFFIYTYLFEKYKENIEKKFKELENDNLSNIIKKIKDI